MLIVSCSLFQKNELKILSNSVFLNRIMILCFPFRWRSIVWNDKDLSIEITLSEGVTTFLDRENSPVCYGGLYLI
jgi:hypothetical protein